MKKINMKKINMKKINTLFLENKISIFILFIALWLIGVRQFDFYWDELSPFWQGVLTEAHGTLFDILLFGIVLTFYEKYNEKRKDIKRLEEEIDDYRDWKEPEATYRIIGCIKRLNRHKVTAIKLHGCFLKNADLTNKINLTSSDIWESDLENAHLYGTNLTNCCFNGSNLKNVKFNYANLRNATFYLSSLRKASFKESWLHSTSFERADLREVNFEYASIDEYTNFEEAMVDSINWLETLKSFNIQGYEFIEKNYIVDNIKYLDINNEIYFRVRSRVLLEQANKIRKEQRSKRFA